MDSVEDTCPYCGEPVEILIDAGGGDLQRYVEDCPVCCRPWDVDVAEIAEGEWAVSLRTADD